MTHQTHPGRVISIHALREEGDWQGPVSRPCRTISIHALREEGDSADMVLGTYAD